MTKSCLVSIVAILISVFLPYKSLALTIDANIPLEVRHLLLNDLEFLKTIKGDGATHLNELVFGNGQMNGQAYYRFFSERVKAIGYDNSTQKRGVAYSAVFEGRRSKLWITKAYTSEKYPRILRLSILMHEARHCEEDSSWFHSKCPNPFLDEKGHDVVTYSGKPLAGKEVLCDADEHGSYGVQVIFLKNVEKYCTNCSSDEEKQAGIWAYENFKHIAKPQSRKNLIMDFKK